MMSRRRFDAIYDGLNGAAQKVYAAVPIAERWTITQVMGELQRRGLSHEYRTVQGCLVLLTDHGLVREPTKGRYCREAVRELSIVEPDQPIKEPPMPTPAASPAAVVPSGAAATPVDKLGALAARVTQMAGMLKELAGEISDAAIEVQAQIETTDEGMTKLKQLQALLKSLG
jgi:hypothetical protein